MKVALENPNVTIQLHQVQEARVVVALVTALASVPTRLIHMPRLVLRRVLRLLINSWLTLMSVKRMI